jgi:sulfonate transport system substrate-binding protein
MRSLRVGGVPEHFNLPWHLALEQGLFAKRGLDLTWIDVPNGTGAMVCILKRLKGLCVAWEGLRMHCAPWL